MRAAVLRGYPSADLFLVETVIYVVQNHRDVWHVNTTSPEQDALRLYGIVQGECLSLPDMVDGSAPWRRE